VNVFGEKLKNERILRGYEISDLVAAIGFNEETIVGIESNDIFPPPRLLISLAKYYGETPGYFLTDFSYIKMINKKRKEKS